MKNKRSKIVWIIAIIPNITVISFFGFIHRLDREALEFFVCPIFFSSLLPVLISKIKHQKIQKISTYIASSLPIILSIFVTYNYINHKINHTWTTYIIGYLFFIFVLMINLGLFWIFYKLATDESWSPKRFIIISLLIIIGFIILIYLIGPDLLFLLFLRLLF